MISLPAGETLPVSAAGSDSTFTAPPRHVSWGTIAGLYDATALREWPFPAGVPAIYVGRRLSGDEEVAMRARPFIRPHIEIEDESGQVSKVHCLLEPEVEGGGVRLSDRSKNGTFVEESNLAGGSIVLRPGAAFRVHHHVFVLVTDQGPAWPPRREEYCRAAYAYYGNSLRKASEAFGWSIGKFKRILEEDDRRRASLR